MTIEIFSSDMDSVYTIRKGSKITIPNVTYEFFFPLKEAMHMKENVQERGSMIPVDLRDTIGSDMSQYNDDVKEVGKWK
jgi:hypothetical protein